MSPARHVLAPSGRRPLLRALLVVPAVAGTALLAVAAPAAADDAPATRVVGELVQAWAETEHDHAAAAPAPLSWVETAAGDSVRVPTESVADLPPGATVSVTLGGPVEDEASEDGADPAREVLESDVVAPVADPAPVAAPAGPITNQVTVALVAPGGVEDDGTAVEDVTALVDGEVADFWAEQSAGAIRIGVTASHDWLPTVAGCSDPALLWNETATAVGFQPGPGRHLLLYVPAGVPGCAYALAEVGSSVAGGGRLYVSELSGSVIAHEFGHNFGLGHSAGRQCDGTVETGTCRASGYRDYYDVMGASWARYGSLNVVHAARLGVLPAAAQQELAVTAAPTTVTLAPVSATAGTRAVRLTDAEGVAYWLEYRPAAGADAWLGTAANVYRLESGVLVRRADPFPTSSVLLDGTPSAAAGWDRDLQVAVPVGAPLTLSGGDFTVVVQGVDAAGAVLAVTPSAPVAAVEPAPAPSGRAPGGVLTGRSAAEEVPVPATEVAAEAGFWAPDRVALRSVTATPALAPASDATSGTALLVSLAGTVLLGATVLLVRRLRRPGTR